MIRFSAYLVVLIGIFGLAPADQARANGLLDWLNCSTDITKEIKRSGYSGTAKVGNGWFDGELYNNHKSLKITSVKIRIKGTYDNSKKFTRKHEEMLEILPGYSARILFETYLDDIGDDFEWSILEVRGCSS
mgnify:CR=1 FL=1